MLSSLRKCHRISGASSWKAGFVLASVAGLAGCSADISRFDLGNPEPKTTSSGYGSSGYGQSGGTGRSAGSEYGSAAYDRAPERGGVSRSELPAPQESLTTSAIHPQQPPSYGGSSYGQAPPVQRQPAYGSADQRAPQYGSSGSAPPIAAQAGVAKGDLIEVRPGDTLYALSKRHRVSLAELMSVNSLSSPSLKPGQKLYLPAGATAAREPVGAETYAAAAEPAKPAVDAPSDWSGSYTVRSGDSLYAIARQNNVKLADLERYNGIANSRNVKPGTVLKVPGSVQAPAAETTASRDEPKTPAAVAGPAPGAVRLGEVPSPPPTSSSQQPTLLNGTSENGGPERVAAADTPGSASDAVSPSAQQSSGSVAGSSRLRWPVAGKVISGFGPRPDGTHNDGVNLSTPMGTDVHAAENGVVAYAGDELKGYGNLVLIRHDNGWVTAYAHADEILVKRGDHIKRGQVIAKAGRSGQVDQPQVHFELRQGQKPVDPTPFMESL